MLVLSPMAAMLGGVVMLAGSARAVDQHVSAVVAAAPVEIAAPVAPAATTEAEAKDRDADAADRRRAMMLLIFSASGHPFGFFK